MASLQSQVYINANESYFQLAGVPTQTFSPLTIKYPGGNVNEIIAVNPSGSTIDFNSPNGVPKNRIQQTLDQTNFYVAGAANSNLVASVEKTGLATFGSLYSSDYPRTNLFFEIARGTTNVPTLLINHGSTLPGGVDSSLAFGQNGVIGTTDKLQVGTTSAATVYVGSGGDTLELGPNRYTFASSGVRNGGMIQTGPNIAIGTGSDPGNAGLGIVMSPTQLGFRKQIDNVAGVSMSATGNINTTGAVTGAAGITTAGTIQSNTSAANVGGRIGLTNGDFSLRLIAQGDGYAPGGLGGKIYSTNDGAGGSISTTIFIPGGGCQIDGGTGTMNIAADAVINLNAPIIYYNNQPVPRMYTWSYSTTTAEQQIYAGSGGAPGSFVRFPNNGVAQPRITNPISANHDYWYAPYTGVYLITFSLTGHNLNTGSSATYIALFRNSVVPLGTAVATFGNGIYTTQSSTSYQTLTAGDSLLIAGLNGDGGQVYLYGGCVWTITLVNTLT